ncbi:MAG: PEGA domain-containing protein, partial [Bacillota bacterium]|nr:PEGA domain-containing protein [Bacillota bacterium]
MIKKKKFLCFPISAVFICSLLLSGCSSIGHAQESTFESAYENGEQEESVDIFTSGATVVIESVDEESQTVNVYMVERNESKTLSYTGSTTIQDKYSAGMSAAQLKAGDIAKITYNSELERIGSISLSADAWSHEGVAKYNLNAGNGSASIGDEIYNMSNAVKVYSDGQAIDVTQIISQDVLTFRGIGSNIMSITVDKGHGYLDLENDEAVIGGWIEVGQTVISQIAPDMLLTVPEGSYTVRFSGTGVEETRDIVIERNQETRLDLGDIEIPQPEKGLVTIKVTPETAEVFIDETAVETVYPIRLPVGFHKITAKASGYDTLSEYFQVEGEDITVTLNLEEETVSGNSVGSSVKENVSTITINAPADVEVYQDNLYMGIAPVTYTKTAGSHTITLRKEGYITRSYSIEIPDDDNDVTYSFPDLDPEDAASLSGNTVSG